MKTKIDHLFTGVSGDLYDTRKADWSASPPLRPLYAKHSRNIETGAELRASLRAGDYAWPGGYEIAYMADDGGLLCADCVRKELRSVLWSIRHGVNDGWRIVGLDCAANWDEPETCSHCDKTIG